MSGIRLLQEAEQEAMEVIKRAKLEKAQMLQVAKERARADLDEFRKEQEAELAQKRSQLGDNTKFQDALERKSARLLKDVEQGFKRDAGGVADDLIAKIMNVDTTIKKARKKLLM